MRLQAVPILLATLAFSSALSQWTPPAATTKTTSNRAESARSLFKLFNNQTMLTPSQGNPGSNHKIYHTTTKPTTIYQTTDPNVCYTADQEEGKCVKTSMCELDPQKVDADEIFKYRTATIPADECHKFMICCPYDKIRISPVPPTISTPQGCGYSNAAAGRFRQAMGTSDSGYADFAEFPWMVALLKNSNNPAGVWKSTDYIGGGTLIHKSVVLTVAHKVYNMQAPKLKCRAGEWDTETETESYEHQDREVQKIIPHQQFDKHNAYNDVALLIMKSPFLLEPHIIVGCLSLTVPPPGTLCYTMGWGMDFTKGKFNANTLKKIPMPLMPKHQCERSYRKTRLGPRFSLHSSLTCAGGLRNLDTCFGDGGSPLVCPVGDPSDLRYTVVGMVVYGMECGLEFPTTYAKIPEFYTWVKQRLNMEGFYEMPYSI